MATLSRTVSSLIFLCSFLCPAGVAFAQERPYFVTYDDQLEKRGELEVELLTTSGNVRDENRRYIAPWTEIEYGVTSWWTAELYIEGVTFGGAGSAFTGWRWENRFRPIKGDHFINPVLYVEYENINEASRIQKEIVGRGAQDFEPVNALADVRAHELEGRLILSSGMGRWNVSENLVVEKNLSEEEGFEFGYTVGVSRSFGTGARELPLLRGRVHCCRRSVRRAGDDGVGRERRHTPVHRAGPLVARDSRIAVQSVSGFRADEHERQGPAARRVHLRLIW